MSPRYPTSALGAAGKGKGRSRNQTLQILGGPPCLVIRRLEALAMGYDLHITRRASWSDEDGPEIGEGEWRRLIEEDPELSLDQDTECWFGDKPVVFAAWNGEPGVLGWFGGEISTNNPERRLIFKMVQIAERLGAKVQGDDGEEYPEALERADVRRNTPWWRRLLRG